MKLRTTIILLLVCSGMVAYLYFIERNLPTTDELKEQNHRIFRIKGSDIEKIQLKNGDTVVVCERAADTKEWRIIVPLSVKGNEDAIKSLLGAIESMEEKGDLGKTQSPDYGLQPPRAEVQFWAKGKQENLRIGNKTAVGEKVYVSTTDGKVFIAESYVTDVFKKSLSDLRDRTLLESPISQVTRIVLKKQETVALDCKKEGEKRWQIQQPGSYRADSVNIEDLIRQALVLKAVEFIKEDGSDLVSFGLQPPEGEISLWIEGKEDPQSLLLGKRVEGKQEFYAKLNAGVHVVTVSGQAGELLRKEVIELREKRLLVFGMDEILKLEITRSSQSRLFEKKEGRWEDPKIENAVRQLTFLTFLRIVDLPGEAEFFPTEQTQQVKGWGAAPDPLFTLTIGKKHEEQPEYYGRISGSQEIYILSAGQVENIVVQ